MSTSSLPIIDVTLPIVSPQPRPVRTRVAYLRFMGVIVTAVMRHWRAGDTARCRLCPRCRAYDDGCLMLFTGRIPKDAAALVNSRGRTEITEEDQAARVS